MAGLIRVTMLAAAATALLTAPSLAGSCGDFPTYNQVAESLAVDLGLVVENVPVDKLPKLVADIEAGLGKKLPSVSRGFTVMQDNGVLAVGLESNGCMLSKIIVPPDGKAVLLGTHDGSGLPI